MKRSLIYVLVVIFLLINSNIYAHTGGTNADGCHRNRTTGDFHCHNERAPGAYQRQMEGYRDSNSIGWILLFPIGAFLFFIFRSSKEKKETLPKEKAENKPKLIITTIKSKNNNSINSSKINKQVISKTTAPFKIMCDEKIFNEDELGILNKHGSWLSDLSLGNREPETDEQKKFSRDCKCFRFYSLKEMHESINENEYLSNRIQLVWFKYLYRLKYEKNI